MKDFLFRVDGTRLTQKTVSETIGLCRGVLADGMVDFGEAKVILQWLETHPEVTCAWPFDVLLPRLREMLADDVLDSDEEAELLDTLMKLTGAGQSAQLGQAPSSLPIDAPAPQIIWDRRNFVFTGELACAKRSEAQEATKSLGGLCPSSVSRKTDYLVLGTFGSEGWLYSTHGRKIQDAIELKRDGAPLSIIDEQHWLSSLRLELAKRA